MLLIIGKKFASSNKTQKSARKVGKVAKNQRDNFNMIHDYEKRAKALLGWIDENDKRFSEPSIKKFGRNMKQVMDYNENLKNFKVKEKPPKGKEMGSLEILLVNIRSKQKNGTCSNLYTTRTTFIKNNCNRMAKT